MSDDAIYREASACYDQAAKLIRRAGRLELEWLRAMIRRPADRPAGARRPQKPRTTTWTPANHDAGVTKGGVAPITNPENAEAEPDADEADVALLRLKVENRRAEILGRTAWKNPVKNGPPPTLQQRRDIRDGVRFCLDLVGAVNRSAIERKT